MKALVKITIKYIHDHNFTLVLQNHKIQIVVQNHQIETLVPNHLT